jgi:hypothetical protein
MVAVTADDVLFVAVNEGISPLPEATRPIDGKSFVQVILVAPEEIKFTAAVAWLLQTI